MSAVNPRVFLLVGLLVAMGAVALLVYATRGILGSTYTSYRSKYDREVGDLLRATFSQQTIDDFFVKNCLLAVVIGIVVGLLFRSGPVGVLSVGLGFFVPIRLLRREATKRREKFSDQLEDALVVMSNALRTSPAMVDALRIAHESMRAPASEEFSLVLNDVRLGATMEESLTRLGERMKSPDLDMVLVAVNVARTVGANLGEMLDGIAKTLRELKRLQGLIESKTAEGKMQARVMGGLPILMGGALFLIDEKMILPLFTENLGLLILAVIIVLEVVGVYLINKFSQLDI